MKNQTYSFLTRLFFVQCLILVITADLAAQYVPTLERGDPTYRRRSEIEANSVRTSVFNSGLSGRTGFGQGVPYEWPTGTGRHYIALAGMFVGGEVVNAIGNTI